MHSRVVLAIKAILTIAMLAVGPTPSFAQEPQVPNFWDPKAVANRPASFPDTIQFLATDNHPPFVFRDVDGRLTGFNVDLARAICQVLESSCALRIRSFPDLVPSLREEEGTAIISGLARDTVVGSELAFTDDYLKLPARFVVRTGSQGRFSENDLEGRRLAVETGSRHAIFAKRFFHDAIIVEFETVQGARDALREGSVDAHFGDGLSLSFWLRGDNSHECCTFAGGPWLEPGYFSEGLSIAVRREDEEDLEALNYALRQVHQTGTYRELYLRYFPLSFY